jgi:hypothetical protein
VYARTQLKATSESILHFCTAVCHASEFACWVRGVRVPVRTPPESEPTGCGPGWMRMALLCPPMAKTLADSVCRPGGMFLADDGEDTTVTTCC